MAEVMKLVALLVLSMLLMAEVRSKCPKGCSSICFPRRWAKCTERCFCSKREGIPFTRSLRKLGSYRNWYSYIVKLVKKWVGKRDTQWKSQWKNIRRTITSNDLFKGESLNGRKKSLLSNYNLIYLCTSWFIDIFEALYNLLFS